MADDVDSVLYSLERVMSIVLLGNEDELSILIKRFAERNEYDCDELHARRLFYEAYHLAYSLKILLRCVILHIPCVHCSH